jgi:hypothetical protein
MLIMNIIGMLFMMIVMLTLIIVHPNVDNSMYHLKCVESI